MVASHDVPRVTEKLHWVLGLALERDTSIRPNRRQPPTNTVFFFFFFLRFLGPIVPDKGKYARHLSITPVLFPRRTLSCSSIIAPERSTMITVSIVHDSRNDNFPRFDTSANIEIVSSLSSVSFILFSRSMIVFYRIKVKNKRV